MQNWKSLDKEFIICSAIWFDDGKEYVHQPRNIESGYVITGRRHHNCFMTLKVASNSNNTHLNFEKVQGFLTNKDRFVDRKQAAIIAFDCGQIESLPKNGKLFSEDLY